MTSHQRREAANNSFARQLGTAIVTGHYQPGAKVPSELELAGTAKVSRSVVREALRTLSAKGLLETRRKGGTRVRPRADWTLLDPQLLRWMFEGAPPLEFVRNLFDLRLIVEPAAAAIAAQKRTAQQLSRLGYALEQMSAHGLKSEAGQAADQMFHATVFEATQNELLVSLSSGISAAVRWTTFFKYRARRHPGDPIPQHRLLFEAIANGDADKAHDATDTLIRQALADTESALSRP